MRDEFKVFAVVVMATVLVLGFSLRSAQAADDSGDEEKDYRNLLGKVDGLIRTLRFGNEPTENRINALEDNYRALFGEEMPSILPGDLSKVTVEDATDLRKNVVKEGKERGLELSFLYKYAVLVILAVSILLAITVNMVSRIMVDWEEVNRVREKQSELQDELKKAQKENDSKKVHKLQKKQQEFMQQHMGTMFSPMKTMLIIIIPFIIVFNLLNSIYGGWVVAWVPFQFPWPDINFILLNRFFKGSFVSLGFFGWYLFSYFGLSQLWRKILVPGQ